MFASRATCVGVGQCGVNRRCVGSSFFAALRWLGLSLLTYLLLRLFELFFLAKAALLFLQQVLGAGYRWPRR